VAVGLSQHPLQSDKARENESGDTQEGNGTVNVTHGIFLTYALATRRVASAAGCGGQPSRHHTTFHGHTGMLGWPVMVSPEKLIASEVHELLLETRPQADDENLARAAEITSSPELIAHDDFRANVFLAIQRLRKAIADGASASEAEDLLLDAISAAEHWVQAYP
jgi:hypothetical protein